MMMLWPQSPLSPRAGWPVFVTEWILSPQKIFYCIFIVHWRKLEGIWLKMVKARLKILFRILQFYNEIQHMEMLQVEFV